MDFHRVTEASNTYHIFNYHDNDCSVLLQRRGQVITKQGAGNIAGKKAKNEVIMNEGESDIESINQCVLVAKCKKKTRTKQKHNCIVIVMNKSVRKSRCTTRI